jgi:hypothetical protein
LTSRQTLSYVCFRFHGNMFRNIYQLFIHLL